MKKEELIEVLRTINDDNDEEAAHCRAEELLMIFLKNNGYPDVAAAYEKASQDWWYA